MYKSIAILYLVCFSCYVFFTREPDYLDGEKAPATIQWLADSASKRKIPKAVFHDGYKEHAVDARYVFRNLKNGDRVEVIYQTDRPEKGVVYAFWGYWLTWEELLVTVIIYIVLFQIAVSITKNPTPEALMEQLDYVPEKKTKYKE
ncbi:MAG: hypothetical protein V4450_06210 [Bacteroidota bacterium]